MSLVKRCLPLLFQARPALAFTAPFPFARALCSPAAGAAFRLPCSSSRTRHISAEDLLPLEEYEKIRPQVIKHRTELRKVRRVKVGPFASFTFESRDLMWIQIQEMINIERGGEAQIQDELTAYNPLIPQGNDIVATLMFEIDNREKRLEMLLKLGHVEETVYLLVGGEKVFAKSAADDDVARTTPDGKTSAIHFLRFTLTPQQVALFKSRDTPVLVGMEHPNYLHMCGLPDAVRASICTDLE